MSPSNPTTRPFLLIAAHGERGGEGGNRRLGEVAAKAASLLDWCDVGHGVLSGEPSIADGVIHASCRPVHVYPFFMAAGFFVTRKLPDQLAAAGVSHKMLPVFGQEPALADHVASVLAGSTGAPAALFVAHGSTKDQRSRLATEAFAAAVGAQAAGWALDCAYLEEEPFAHGKVAALPQGATIVSLFAGAGLHGADDLTEIIEEAGRNDLAVLTPAGDTDLVARLAAAAMRNVCRNP